jgi:dolichol-phosphate mannosyltransferase
LSDQPAPGREPLDRVLVCIPTYNERENLPLIVPRVRESVPSADILVLDDNSPDGTGEVADQLAEADPKVRVLHRPGKEGLALDHADLVIGSRWIRGGSVVNWPMHRKALSVGGNLYIRVLLGMPVNDATAGFRAYRSSALRSMGLDHVASQGYCFQVDLTQRAVRRDLRVREVPITFVEREVGDSKMSGDIMRESLQRITAWGLQHRAEQLRRVSRREPTWHRL